MVRKKLKAQDDTEYLYPARRTKSAASARAAGVARNGRFLGRGQLKMLPDMPLDILFEIFGHLEPPDVLGLSRTTKALRNILMSRSAISIWKSAFKNDPDLPEVPNGLNEPQYANLAFSPHCHTCFASGEHNILWAFQVRLCEKCMKGRFDGSPTVLKKYPDVLNNAHLLRSALVGMRHYEEVAEINKQLVEFKKGDSKLEEFVSARKAFVEETHQVRLSKFVLKFSNRAQGSGLLRAARKERLLQEARDRRKEARLGDLGYSDEVEYLNTTRPLILNEHPLVVSGNILTDQEWNTMKSQLVRLMQGVTEKMQRKKRKLLLKNRKRLMLSVLKEYMQGRPLDEINPRAVDIFCSMPRIKAMIEDPSTDAYTTEDNFRIVLTDLPELCEQWRESKIRVLLALLPDGNDHNSGVLFRATTFFRCADCSEPIGYPRVLAHVCLFELRHGIRNRDDELAHLCLDFDSEPWNADGRRVAHYPAAATSAASVVRACGLDTELTTSQDMDDVGAWLECLRCSHKVKGRAVFRWRKAILHDMYHAASAETFRWRLLNDDDTDAAEALQQKTYETCYSDALDYVCTHCRQQISFAQMRVHMQFSHSIRDPDLEEDYVLHADASMLQPPFPLMLPHASPEVIELDDSDELPHAPQKIMEI
ncbi:hypothetical protein GGX14DRAFT_355645 [Mycena pura]|uniref:F-box domain-containing protein n=1 Tax=Mycena pura TaxID=153505 RepID=A0AAD6VRF1_9AGAR|nr:hypothetical protein GGX14DRAFT_355645 [Mycena pura]